MKPPISVTVTGANIQKSAAVAEVIAEALTEKGFTNASYVNAPPPKLQAVSSGGTTRSLLQQIQATYPDFLEDPIHVRAVMVAGLDMSGEEVTNRYLGVDDNTFAHSDVDKEGVNETTIFIREEGFPPQPKWYDDPDTVEVVKRAADIARKAEEILDDKHYRQAAQELHAEGKIGPNKKAQLTAVETTPITKSAITGIVDDIVTDAIKNAKNRADKAAVKSNLRVVADELVTEIDITPEAP